MIMTNLKNRKYAASRREAKRIFEAITGVKYNRNEPHHSGIRVYTLKKKTATRTHYVGTHMEWLNK